MALSELALLDNGRAKWHNPPDPTSTIPKDHVAPCRAPMEDEVGISAAPSVTVRIPPALVKRTGGLRYVTARGRTVREVIDNLGAEFPGLRFNLCYETGELREYVNVFVGGEEVRYLEGLNTEVPEGSTLHILQSVAGGQ